MKNRAIKILLLIVAFFPTKHYIVGQVINEFMASNGSIQNNPSDPSETPDWVEIYNEGETTLNLQNYYLTDDVSLLTKWKITTSVEIPSKQHEVFFLNNKPELGPFNATFKLNAEKGYILLVAPDGLTVVDIVEYPRQFSDVSYQRYPDGTSGYIYSASSTPGTNNLPGYSGVIYQLDFSHRRGFYESAFQTTITSSVSDVNIYYTLDGSDPIPGVSNLYNGPLTISTTTCVRAIGVKDGWRSSDPVCHTYIFMDDVKDQPVNPPGFPRNWAHTGDGDYEMDPDVVYNPDYQDSFIDDMNSIPTISLVMDVDLWFDEDTGIYYDGQLEERAVSAEYFLPDKNDNFQLNCAVMVVGGTSPYRWRLDKLSLRLKFKTEYGASSLEYPLLGNDYVDKFNTLVLDARANNTWAYGGTWPTGRADGSGQRELAQYTRDQFTADLQNLAGGYGYRGRYVNLYLNGLYWGIYNVHERPDEHYAAEHLGGKPEDYDVLKHNSDEVINGSNTDYLEVFQILSDVSNAESRFTQVADKVDLVNLADYIIINYYLSNRDWDHHNWYATRNRVIPGSKWQYHSWDAEHTMEQLDFDATELDNAESPTRIQHRLAGSRQYIDLFNNRVQKLFGQGGLLSQEKLGELYQLRLDHVKGAVVGESARWGDNRESTPFTRDDDWMAETEWIFNTFFTDREDILMEQLLDKGWISPVDAPVFYRNGKALVNESFLNNDRLSIEAGQGTIYYTTDGSDPLVLPASLSASNHFDGEINASAAEYTVALTINQPLIIKARALYNNVWSAMNEISVHVTSGLVVSELYYNPYAEVSFDTDNFEFLKLRNNSNGAINLSNYRFVSGIDYNFPNNTILQSNQEIVLCSNEYIYNFFYTPAPFQSYTGNLNNGGERLRLVNTSGDTVLNFKYDDEYLWPSKPDGNGYSLVMKDKYAIVNTMDPTDWETSSGYYGVHAEDIPWQLTSIAANQIQSGFNVFPNPFREKAVISIVLKTRTNTEISIYNLQGQIVATVHKGWLPEGKYEFAWNGETNNNKLVKPGMYLVRYISDENEFSSKLTYLGSR